MFLTNILLKRVKSKSIMVLVESVASQHKIPVVRERLAPKLELVMFDPYVQEHVVYRELKKIKSV